MKKIISILLISMFAISCHSQKKTSENQVLQNKSAKPYFLGAWKLTKRTYKEGEIIKDEPLHDCMKKYELVFKQKGENTFLIKNFSTGENCSVKSSSGELMVKIDQNSFSYLDYDLKKSEQYKIYSEKRFSILYNEILNGKMVEFEDFYEK